MELLIKLLVMSLLTSLLASCFLRKEENFASDAPVRKIVSVFPNDLIYQSSMDEKIVYAFRKIVCRMPKEKEKQLLKSYFENEKKLTASKSSETESFIKTGEFKSKNISDHSSMAALMKVIMTIYNMEETIMKTWFSTDYAKWIFRRQT